MYVVKLVFINTIKYLEMKTARDRTELLWLYLDIVSNFRDDKLLLIINFTIFFLLLAILKNKNKTIQIWIDFGTHKLTQIWNCIIISKPLELFHVFITLKQRV